MRRESLRGGISVAVVGLGTLGLVLAAGQRTQGVLYAYVHMGLAAATALSIASLAIGDCRRMLTAGASASAVAASNALYMGIIWSWGALAVILTYATGVLAWWEWWQFAIAFTAAAAVSLYFSAALKADAAAGAEDPVLLRRARYAAIVQLAGMVITMAGLLVDGKMTRFLTPRFTDWAANNIFFFGALAIALISGYALRVNKHA
jgi:hypothetical protein